MDNIDIIDFFTRVNIALTDGQLHDLRVIANSDPEEGAEWLPYYKMSLIELCACVMTLREMVTDPDAIAAASLHWKRHLLLGGIGPQTDPEAIDDVMAMVRVSVEDFCLPTPPKGD